MLSASSSMELRHLRYFVAVAGELNFSRAAQRLRISQPPLSQQIRQLEEELEAKLFYRDKRRVELTHAGHVFLVDTKKILVDVAEAARKAKSADRGEVGHLRIGFGLASIDIVMPVMESYRQQSRHVELVLHELLTNSLLPALRDKQIEVAFLCEPSETDPTKAFGRKTHIAVETLTRELVFVVFQKDHPRRQQSEIRLESLATEDFGVIARPTAPAIFDHFQKLCHDSGFEPHIVLEATQPQAILGGVATGRMVSILPDHYRKIHHPGVIFKPLESAKAHLEKKVAWLSENKSAALQMFLEATRKVVAQRRN